MKIHFVSTGLRANSGFSVVTKNLAIGLRGLGHDVTMSGLLTANYPEYAYGFEIMPIITHYVDDLTQFLLNLQIVKPDVAIYIHQMDSGQFNAFAKVFKNTICLLPESLILTLGRGTQKIKDIKIGDKVITHKGRFMRVSNVMKREYYGDIIKITSHKLKIPIMLTPEHKVLAMRTSECIGHSGVTFCRPGAKCYNEYNGTQHKKCKYIHGEEPWRKYKTQWIDAKNLKVGDWVVYPKANDKVIDIEKMRIIDYIDDIINIRGDYWEDNSQQTDLFGSFIDKTISSKYHLNKSIPAEIIVDKDFMRLCGYFIAEGGINYNYEENRNMGIHFAFNINEEKYIKDVECIMENIFGVKFTKKLCDNDNGINLIYTNKILGDFFENLFAPREYQTKKGRGRKSNIVRIPSEFINLPLDKLKEMIKGIWRGDGSYYKSPEISKQNRYEYSIGTTSSTLAFQLIYIMSRFNILCSIDLRHPKKENHSIFYDVSILGEDIDIFENIINENNLVRTTYRQVNKYIRGNKSFYLPITSIDTIKYNGDVWNLDVEEDNSYVSTIAIHNCYTPVETLGIPEQMRSDLLSIVMNGGKVLAQTKYGSNEMSLALGGIHVSYIYHGWDDKIFRPLNFGGDDRNKKGKGDIDQIRYCYYGTDSGKADSDPIKLYRQGCYNCIFPDHQKIKCQYYKEEHVSMLRFINGKWTGEDIPITTLPGITKGKFKYLFVGQNLGIRKRIERLLKAYSLMINNRQLKDRTILHLHTIPISIVGLNLIRIIDDLGIQNNVIFSYGSSGSGGSSLTDQAMNIIYNTADVNVTASSGEGTGFSTLESMAIGIPTLGPRNTSFIELVEEETMGNEGNDEKKILIGPRGLLCDGIYQMLPDGTERFLVDEQELALNMERIYKDDNLRESYGENCLKFSKMLTWNRIVQKWDKLLKEK